jgi:hypothetical protein
MRARETVDRWPEYSLGGSILFVGLRLVLIQCFVSGLVHHDVLLQRTARPLMRLPPQRLIQGGHLGSRTALGPPADSAVPLVLPT